MAISRMQEPQQIRLGLGSLQDPRQGYLFGGVAKAVKKAVRGVKKIAKSPLGKAALAGAAVYGLGAYGPGGFNKGRFLSRIGLGGIGGTTAREAAIMRNAGASTGFLPKVGGFLKSMVPGMGSFSGKNLALGLGTLAVATPFIQKAMGAGPYQEIEEEVDESYIPPAMALAMAKNRDPYMNFLPNEQYVQSGFYQPAANGGRIGYANGEMVEASMTEDIQLPPEAEKFLRQEYQKYVAQGGELSYPEFKMMVLQQASGEQGPEQEEVMTTEAETIQTEPQMPMMMANGGLTSVPGYVTPPGTNRFNYPSGGVRVGRAEGGLMNLGGMEKDYRAEGGFVPIGKAEKADDVPARLSVNEFVFTADAVRNAGGGDIDKGAEVMENLMNHLEAGGKVSEESQGAQAMYDNMKQLETRVI
jgi:hypothetical protein